MQPFKKRGKIFREIFCRLVDTEFVKTCDKLVADGLEDIENEVTKLRWPNDRRLSDVK